MVIVHSMGFTTLVQKQAQHELVSELDMMIICRVFLVGPASRFVIIQQISPTKMNGFFGLGDYKLTGFCLKPRVKKEYRDFWIHPMYFTLVGCLEHECHFFHTVGNNNPN